MRGNLQVRFLGEEVAVMSLPYPTSWSAHPVRVGRKRTAMSISPRAAPFWSAPTPRIPSTTPAWAGRSSCVRASNPRSARPRTRQTVFLVVLLAGLASGRCGGVGNARLTRRLAALADEAQAVRRGARRALTVPAGADEVSHIGATLAEPIEQLQQEKQALTTLNADSMRASPNAPPASSAWPRRRDMPR